jgi:hypothetical protein
MIGHIYKGSIALAVMELFPDHAWQPWRFFTPPPRVWDSKQTRLEFFDWASVQLNLSNLDGWYSVTRKDLTQIGGMLENFSNQSESHLTSFLVSVRRHATHSVPKLHRSGIA